MKDCDIDGIAGWLVERGLDGTSEAELLHGFCERLRAAGLPLSRGLLLIDTLHPVHEGRAFRWRLGDGNAGEVLTYGRTNEGEAAEAWRRSPFYHMLQTGSDAFRLALRPGMKTDWPILDAMADEGVTEYFALIHSFATDGRLGEMDCAYSAWSTEAPGGFGEADLAALRRLAPPLVLAVKCHSLARIAKTLAEVYLGRDPARLVLDGRIARGAVERIRAALWFSDLRGFTSIADTAPPEEVIPLLNDYAEAVITAVQSAGGDVLKLMGDGVLAVFKADSMSTACVCALTAERSMREAVAALNSRRAREGRPFTDVYLGLHAGDVFYGNIGSDERLDFTVVGPAVNEASRIASLCRSAGREVLLSAEFAGATPAPDRARLLSVGSFDLRGVSRPRELFTLSPPPPASPPPEGDVRHGRDGTGAKASSCGT